MARQLHNGLFPNIGKGDKAAYNSIDAPMWFFWAVQEYDKAQGEPGVVWKNYGGKMKSILTAFREGVNPGLRMDPSGLIWARQPGKALTWMDAVVRGVPVTPRAGYAVEINALWYNAVCYMLKLAGEAKDQSFIKEWQDMPELIRKSFVETFWNEEYGYLADYVDEEGQNLDVRPNQVFACSLMYSPLTDDMKERVLRVVTKELLTQKGLRTLSPKNPKYHGHYEGNQDERDNAYHQGTVWPWLIGAYIEANLQLYGKQFLPEAKELLEGFEEDMTVYGLCSVAEVYDGDPPHHPNGSISQAWSVGEILRSMELIRKYEN